MFKIDEHSWVDYWFSLSHHLVVERSHYLFKLIREIRCKLTLYLIDIKSSLQFTHFITPFLRKERTFRKFIPSVTFIVLAQIFPCNIWGSLCPAYASGWLLSLSVKHACPITACVTLNWLIDFLSFSSIPSFWIILNILLQY